MPYDYHKMSPEERAAVLSTRRQAGHPLHAPPHPYRGGGCFFITAANYRHRHILSTSARLGEFEERLLSRLREADVDLRGWVILTNHYHFLVAVESLDQISAALQHVHGSTSREWNMEDGLTGSRRVWYKFRDEYVRGEPDYNRALNYIHYNPVKHGHAETPYAWPWSSIHLYFETYGRPWLRQRWTEHFPGSGWRYGDVEGLNGAGRAKD